MISPEIAITNRTPIQALNQGDLIMAGGFPVKLTKVTGGGSFNGEGYVTIPMLGQVNVKVRFSGIQVNTERQLFGGVIETTYDIKETQIVDTKEIEEGIRALADVVKKLIGASDKIDQLLEKDNATQAELEVLQKELITLTKQKDSLTNSSNYIKQLSETIPTYQKSGVGVSLIDNSSLKTALKETSVAIKADAAMAEEKQFASFVKLYDAIGYNELSYRLYQIYKFYKKCSDENWKPYNNEGIIPYCFWKNSQTEYRDYYTFLDKPYSAGVFDGIYGQGKSIYDLREKIEEIRYAFTFGYADCKGIKIDKKTVEKLNVQLKKAKNDSGFSAWLDEIRIPNKLATIKECQGYEEIRNETAKTINSLYHIISNQDKIEKALNTITKQLVKYIVKLNGTSNTQRYEHGKLVSNLATLLIGTGEGKAAANSAELLEYWATRNKGIYDDLGKLLLKEGDDVTNLLLKSGEDFTILSNARKLPGKAIGSGKEITGTWLRGTEANAGLFPKSVADKLKGKTFKNFDEFRGEFWKTVANDPILIKQFTARDIMIMKNGLAPEVLESQRLGGQIKYVLHHKTPINRGGGVYDMDNLYIVTPKYHKSILDPAYHYGYGY